MVDNCIILNLYSSIFFFSVNWNNSYSLSTWLCKQWQRSKCRGNMCNKSDILHSWNGKCRTTLRSPCYVVGIMSASQPSALVKRWRSTSCKNIERYHIMHFFSKYILTIKTEIGGDAAYLIMVLFTRKTDILFFILIQVNLDCRRFAIC